jgi:glutamine amidotransferase
VTSIAVVDHGAGNLVSIEHALIARGATVTVTADPSELRQADGVVLPGVGATATVMAGIEEAGLAETLRSLRTPLLGICVGMQVLFEWSEEDDTAGLGLLAGTVRRLQRPPRIPHIGWNEVASSHPLFAGTDLIFYFVHSYAPVPVDPEVVAGLTEYGEAFVSAVASRRCLGVQFHPERSGPAGLRLLENFVSYCREAAVVA